MPHLHETRRRLSNLIRLGTILAVDHGHARCRVQTDNNQTDWLPWVTPQVGKTIEWSAPSIGEQVIVLSPEGVLTGAVVLRGLYCTDFPPPSDAENIHLTVHPDGAIVEYDHAAHALRAILPGNGTVVLTAMGGTTINGPLTVNGEAIINGDTYVSQTLTAQTDVIGGGVSLKDHVHGGVVSGPASTGPPQ